MLGWMKQSWNQDCWEKYQYGEGNNSNLLQYLCLENSIDRGAWWERSLVAQTVKRLLTMRETWVQSPAQEYLLEKEMATHSSILAWRIPQTDTHLSSNPGTSKSDHAGRGA